MSDETQTEEQTEEQAKPRTTAELAEAVYGDAPSHPRYSTVTDDGRVQDVIRDRDGHILHRSHYNGNLKAMVGAHSQELASADLREVDLERREIPDIHAVGAAFGSLEGSTVRGGVLKNATIEGSMRDLDARFCDLRGIEVGADTDIAGARFDGCLLDQETYERLRRCKGSEAAVGLKRP